MGKVQIVIEIDDKLHGRIFHSDTIYDDDKADVVKAIVNGTPLPKNHGDLIDRDALELDTEWDAYYDAFCSYSQMQIDDAPTIIEAEVIADEDSN